MSNEAATPVAHLKQSVETSIASITRRVRHRSISDAFVAVYQLLCYQMMLGQIISLFGATKHSCKSDDAAEVLQFAIDTENGKQAGSSGVSHPNLFAEIVAKVGRRHNYRLGSSRFNQTLNTLVSLVEKNPLYGLALSYYLYSVYPLLKELLYETCVSTLALDVAHHAYWRENTLESIVFIRQQFLTAYGREVSEHLLLAQKHNAAIDRMIHLVEEALVQMFVPQAREDAHVAAPHVSTVPMAAPAAV